jgi:pimeloyl-ACP methyl ester carboxylesterase
MSSPVDRFRLAYHRARGGEQAVVLLHGWPGDHTDYRLVDPLLGDFDVITPDLRGFGRSDKHRVDPVVEYGAAGQARSIAALIEELGLHRPVVAGYDVGSRVAQALARSRPELVRAVVLGPPLPGAGDRVLATEAQREFWYQAFHRLPLAESLVDGNRDAVAAYLRHFWTHWSGPNLTDPDIAHLVESYSPPGAFTASINWYRAGAGTVATSLAERPPEPDQRLTTRTVVLWPEHDPLFPRAWSDRVAEFFADVTVQPADGIGHFIPLEGPDSFAGVIRRQATSGPDAVPSA